jgi:adenosylcobyric acid synthase
VAGVADGLGLLDIDTVLTGNKTLRSARGVLARSAQGFSGYEMHLGVTTGPGLDRPFLIHDDGRPDGAVSADGRIAGTYVHGLFGQGEARAALLAGLGVGAAPGDHARRVDGLLNELAEALALSLDIDALARIAGL